MTLTEKWDKGELPEGDYYIKRRNGDFLYDNIDTSGVWRNSIDEDILEVLAPVPSYEEWQASYNCMLENEVLRLKNAKLKELLKECREMLKEYQFSEGDFTIGDNLEMDTSLLLKVIDNTIGEKK